MHVVESVRTRVRRIAAADGSSVMVKEALGPLGAARMQHERAILECLSDVGGVSRLAEAQAPDGIGLTLVDSGPADLAEMIEAGEVDTDRLPAMALRLATILAAVHRAGVIHRDINPANIVFPGEQADPVLIDFDLATTFAEVRPGFTHPDDIVGTLPYLAPEQTGRTAASVDQRADVYGLGATLYAAATGTPPFGDGDALELVRDILARRPASIGGLLGEIVARMLEKEPGRRYQSAAGLAYDLRYLVEHGRAPVPLGARDFPDRLRAPSLLVGRDDEQAVLAAALDGTVRPGARVVLLSGASGVGKSALINQLAPLVTARRGWFVAAKHDQYHRDATSGGMLEALRALASLVLAESDDVLLALRGRLAERLGRNRDAAAGMMPEFAALLGVAVVPDGASVPSGLVYRIALEMLRVVASPQRPVTLVLDDLQWASDSALRFADTVVTDAQMCGVLLVGAYREQEVDAAHPLTAMRSRWARLGVAPQVLRLANLGGQALGEMVAEMLRLPPDRADQLAAVLAERCAGNPFDTVELINALRREGALTLGDDGWQWQDAMIRRHVGDGDVIDLLAARLAGLPPATLEYLRVMACLGAEVTFDLLGVGAGSSATAAYETLVPALEDGLVATDGAGTDVVRFRHDRVQQAVYAGRPDDRPGHLAIARRLAADGRFDTEAAEEFLAVVDDIVDPAERRLTAQLCEAVAAGAARVNNYAAAERHLRAAVRLRPPEPGTADPALAALHAALYHLGRLAEADEVYGQIVAAEPDVEAILESACVQIASLTNRARAREAVALALPLLAQLGLPVPAGDLTAVVRAGLPVLRAWIDGADVEADVARPEMSERLALAASRLIDWVATPAFFTDIGVLGWLVGQAQRLWQQYGPYAGLAPVLTLGINSCITLGDDYELGPRIGRHVLAVSERRGYGRETAHTRFVYTGTGRHWSQPVEGNVTQAAIAREGLISNGDPQHACFTYLVSVAALLDVGSSLDELLTEIDAALALAARCGNGILTGRMLPYRQFVRALRGQTRERGAFSDAEYDPDQALRALTGNTMGITYLHAHRALAAAIFGDATTLAREAEAAMVVAPSQGGIYPGVLCRLMHALAVVRAGGEVTSYETWFAARAEQMPGNFRHLLLFVRAERAWAAGDRAAAQQAFDGALHELDARRRCWQRAMIAERAAALSAELGLRWVEHRLLREARSGYHGWGATEKVRQLDERYPELRQAGERRAGRSSSASVSAADIDLLALLRASQTISSETSLDRLHTAVTEQLRAIAGATDLHMLVRDGGDWVLLTDAEHLTAIPAEDAGAQGLLPLTVFRYVERTGEILHIDDLTEDNRFRRDPYLQGLDRCSLLVVPISRQGTPVAMLILENRLSAHAFTADRLDAVQLIAGQLAVSVGNALLYRTLEQRVTDRTAELKAANTQLESLNRTDPLTGMANRRRFDEQIAAGWDDEKPVSVVMIDIDYFKRYNDGYGHPAGDACLRAVATAIMGALRDGDVVCRYGGEEFAIVLVGTALADALAALERVRAAVEALAIAHEHSPHGVVSVSIGVSGTARHAPVAPELLMKSADEALYQAKQHGRNQVAAAPAPVE
jgi:diguanylate cyclase (GGDEF)-like protein